MLGHGEGGGTVVSVGIFCHSPRKRNKYFSRNVFGCGGESRKWVVRDGDINLVGDVLALGGDVNSEGRNPWSWINCI